MASGSLCEARSLTTETMSSVSVYGEFVLVHDGQYHADVYDEARIDGAKITLFQRATEVLSVQCDWSPAGVRTLGHALPKGMVAWISIDRVEIPTSFDWVVSRAERTALREIYEVFSDIASVAHKSVKEFDGPWDLDEKPPLTFGNRKTEALGLFIGCRMAPGSVKNRPGGVPVVRLPVNRCELRMDGKTVDLFASSRLIGTWTKVDSTKNVLSLEGTKGGGYALTPEKSMFTALVELPL